jgi:hypothetical protein
VVYGVTLIVSWVDTTSNRHADLLSRWHDAAEPKGALLAELRALRSSAGPRRRLGPAHRRQSLLVGIHTAPARQLSYELVLDKDRV